VHATSAPAAPPSATSSPTPAAADTLTTSQPFIAAIPDLAAFATAQCTCPKVGLMRQSPSLDIVCRLVGTVYLFGDVSTPLFRPLVPLPFRLGIFDGLHNASILVYKLHVASSPRVLSGPAWRSRSMSGLASALPDSELRLWCTPNRRRRRFRSRRTVFPMSTLT
jgi:hypothetical protein